VAVITYRDCRALRHAWERLDGFPNDVTPPPETDIWYGARYIISVRCLRCAAVRFVAIDHRGHKLAAIYRYPDDYLRPKGEPRVSFDDMMLWLAKPNGRTRAIDVDEVLPVEKTTRRKRKR
jgi:hypothetical protein